MKKIIIFGTSLLAEQTYFVLDALENYKVVAWTQNNLENSKINNEKFGLPIIPVSELYNYKEAHIVIGSMYYVDIGNQLYEMGIKNYYDSIHIIISNLSDLEKFRLKQKLISKQLPKIDLDYNLNTLLNTGTTQSKDDNDKYILISDNYPTEGDPYSCAFVHRRVINYKKSGLDFDVFSCTGYSLDKYIYDSVEVYRGDYFALMTLLSKKRYKKILVHFLCENIYYCIKKANVLNVPIIVWCHRTEIVKWTSYFNNFTQEEINIDKTNFNLSHEKKMKFFQEVFKNNNIRFIFVSNWLKNKVLKNIGSLPKHYNIIPNYIEENMYIYHEKNIEYRKKIISIKSNNSRNYANDITAKAIIELSSKEFFNDLCFSIYGDGSLFEQNFSELKKLNFPNVKIEKKFFKQNEIVNLFNENGIFLSPTRSDSQGVIAGEAMSSGLVVISCNTTAIPEFIDEDCGSLYEFDNYLEMAEEIEFLYYHPEEFLRKSQNATKRVKNQCGYNATIEKELKLIQKEEYIIKDFDKRIFDFDYIYIYGNGNYGKAIKKSFQKFKIPFKGVLVSSEYKKDESEIIIDDLNVHPQKTCIIIGTDSKYYSEVISNISKRGYNNLVFFSQQEKNKIVSLFGEHNKDTNEDIFMDESSATYWENRYMKNGNSGAGSYNRLAEFKAKVINTFLTENPMIKLCFEWGCGDGNQLSYINYPSYIGTDVSKTALNICKIKFAHDKTKSFIPINDMQNYIIYNKCNLALSLDVIYHLVENDVFENYMEKLFLSTNKYVCIYSSNFNSSQKTHQKNRKFTDYIQEKFPEFKLIKKIENEFPYDIYNAEQTSLSDFYFYEKTEILEENKL